MTGVTRRETIADSEITKEVLDVIMGKMFEKFTKEEIELSQQNIIKTLLPLKLSNKMIAKVIKELIPDSNPSAGSVAIQIRNINKKKNKPITVQYLGEQITFDSIEDMAKSLNATIKQLPKNSMEYIQLRMIQLQYNI